MTTTGGVIDALCPLARAGECSMLQLRLPSLGLVTDVGRVTADAMDDGFQLATDARRVANGSSGRKN